MQIVNSFYASGAFKNSLDPDEAQQLFDSLMVFLIFFFI